MLIAIKASPTPAQIEAGNYPKRHLWLHGFNISIENPKGSTRSGVDRHGEKWSQKITTDYGYIRGTNGGDDEQIDCYVGPHPESEKVFVINQVVDGQWDEHKVILGVDSEQEAREIYLSNYKPGWNGLSSIKEKTLEEFKHWLKNGRTDEAIKGLILDDEARKLAEDAVIREAKKKPEALQPHKFKPAQWTHKNGHPRCLICGDEPTMSGICNKALDRTTIGVVLKAIRDLPLLPSKKNPAVRRHQRTAAQALNANMVVDQIASLKEQIEAKWHEYLKGGKDPDAKGQMQELEARLKELAAKVSPKTIGVIEYFDPQTNKGAVIHASTKNPGAYQVTFFDDRGFMSDEQAKDILEAVHDARTIAKQRSSGQLDKLATTEAFQKGNELSRVVGMANQRRFKGDSQGARDIEDAYDAGGWEQAESLFKQQQQDVSKSIRDLPLLPSHANPRIRRHQRTDIDPAVEQGARVDEAFGKERQQTIGWEDLEPQITTHVDGMMRSNAHSQDIREYFREQGREHPEHNGEVERIYTRWSRHWEHYGNEMPPEIGTAWTQLQREAPTQAERARTTTEKRQARGRTKGSVTSETELTVRTEDRQELDDNLLYSYGTSIDKIAAAFSLKHDEFYTGELTITAPTNANELEVYALIRRRSDNAVAGSALQSIYLGAGRAYISSFFLKNKYQGKGIAADLLEQSFAYYKKAGIERVDLLADGDVGKYAWALYGFDFTDEDRRAGMLENFQSVVNDFVRSNDAKFTRQQKNKIIEAAEKCTYAWDIARFRINGEKIGRDFLLDMGDWNGEFKFNAHVPHEKIFKLCVNEQKAKARHLLAKAIMGDKDSEIFHRGVLKNEDKILEALDKKLGSLDFDYREKPWKPKVYSALPDAWKAIRDLPLLPSKKNPTVKRHQQLNKPVTQQREVSPVQHSDAQLEKYKNNLGRAGVPITDELWSGAFITPDRKAVGKPFYHGGRQEHEDIANIAIHGRPRGDGERSIRKLLTDGWVRRGASFDYEVGTESAFRIVEDCIMASLRKFPQAPKQTVVLDFSSDNRSKNRYYEFSMREFMENDFSLYRTMKKCGPSTSLWKGIVIAIKAIGNLPLLPAPSNPAVRRHQLVGKNPLKMGGELHSLIREHDDNCENCGERTRHAQYQNSATGQHASVCENCWHDNWSGKDFRFMDHAKKAIGDLPLSPSKKNPAVMRHQGSNRMEWNAPPRQPAIPPGAFRAVRLKDGTVHSSWLDHNAAIQRAYKHKNPQGSVTDPAFGKFSESFYGNEEHGERGYHPKDHPEHFIRARDVEIDKAIRDLPLKPSKKNPSVMRHQTDEELDAQYMAEAKARREARWAEMHRRNPGLAAQNALEDKIKEQLKTVKSSSFNLSTDDGWRKMITATEAALAKIGLRMTRQQIYRMHASDKFKDVWMEAEYAAKVAKPIKKSVAFVVTPTPNGVKLGNVIFAIMPSVRKGIISTPHLPGSNKIDWANVPVGASVWITVTDPSSPLAGRHILITKRADNQAVIDPGEARRAGYKVGDWQEESGLAHASFQMGALKEQRKDVEQWAAYEKRREERAPYEAKLKEVRHEASAKTKELEQKFLESVGISKLGLTQVQQKVVVESAKRQATNAGMEESLIEGYAKTVAKVQDQIMKRMQREAALRKFNYYKKVLEEIIHPPKPEREEPLAGTPLSAVPDKPPEGWKADVGPTPNEPMWIRDSETVEAASAAVVPREAEGDSTAAVYDAYVGDDNVIGTFNTAEEAAQAIDDRFANIEAIQEVVARDEQPLEMEAPEVPLQANTPQEVELATTEDMHKKAAQAAKRREENQELREEAKKDAIVIIPTKKARDPLDRVLLTQDKEAAKTALDDFNAFTRAMAEKKEILKIIPPRLPRPETVVVANALEALRQSAVERVTDEDVRNALERYAARTKINGDESFYSVVHEHWNDEVGYALNGAVANGGSEYLNGLLKRRKGFVSGAAAAALTGLVGKHTGIELDVGRLSDAFSPQVTASIVGYWLVGQARQRQLKGQSITAIIQAIENDNKTNLLAQEQKALDEDKKLKATYQEIQRQKANGELTAEATIMRQEAYNILQRRQNIGRAYGSLAASGSLLLAMKHAQAGIDERVTINVGMSKDNAYRILKEKLNVSPSKIPEQIKIAHNIIGTDATTGEAILQYQITGNASYLANRWGTQSPILSREVAELNKIKTDNTPFTPMDRPPHFKREWINDAGVKEDFALRLPQRNDINWLNKTGGGLLTRTTGAGKTLTTAGWWSHLLAKNPHYKGIVLCPDGLTAQWADQLHRATDLDILVIPEKTTKEERQKFWKQIKPGQLVIASHSDALRSQWDVDAITGHGFDFASIDEPQNLKSQTSERLGSAAKRIVNIPFKHRVALSASPARESLDEIYEWVNWATKEFAGYQRKKDGSQGNPIFHSKIGSKVGFGRMYAGGGNGTNAQDEAIQQQIFQKISPYVSGDQFKTRTESGKAGDKPYKVVTNDHTVKRSQMQIARQKEIEAGYNTLLAKITEEETAKGKRMGRTKAQIGQRINHLVMKEMDTRHWNNLHGGEDNAKAKEVAKTILSEIKEGKTHHVVFIDSEPQRVALNTLLRKAKIKAYDLTELNKRAKFKEEAEQIAKTENLTPDQALERVVAQRKEQWAAEKNKGEAGIMFIDKTSQAGHNLQTADSFHQAGRPQDAAGYYQGIGRVDRAPRKGDIALHHYRYTDSPFEDAHWTEIENEMKVIGAITPALLKSLANPVHVGLAMEQYVKSILGRRILEFFGVAQ